MQLPVGDLKTLSPSQQIERGELFLRQRKPELAVQALRPLYVRRAKLGREETLRLALAYAKALDRQGMPDDAIDVLRRVVAGMDKISDRRQVYLLASDLYERHGHWDRAIEAIQGKL